MATCEDKLVEQAARGDTEAFRHLWDAHHAVAMAAAFRLCHHHALYQRPISLDETSEIEKQPGSEQLDLQEQVAQREEIRQALAKLNPDQRRVIALRYGADLTEVDIAHVLGWPIGTVKSRLKRARDHLRLLLMDERRNRDE